MTIHHKFFFITCILLSFTLVGCGTIDNTGAYNGWNNKQQTTQPDRPQTTIPAPVRENGQTVPKQPTPQAQNNVSPVKVAILLPLSGRNSALGQSMLQAAQLALFDMGSKNFTLIPRDTQGTAQGASLATTKAINDGAQLILGPLFSDSVRATQAIARQSNVNVIAFSTDWALADRQTFLMGFMPFSQVERITQYSTQKGYRNFAMIAPKNKYGDIVTQRFTKETRDRNTKITQSVRFVDKDPAVINQIEQLKGNTINAVFMPVGGNQTDIISSALSFNGFTPDTTKRIGTGLWDDKRIASQKSMEGAWFAAPSHRQRKSFEQRYADTYGQSPVRIASLAYDATALAAVLAQNNGGFSYGNIINPNGFAGTDGIFRFQPNGLVERGLAVFEIRSGQIVEIESAPNRF